MEYYAGMSIQVHVLPCDMCVHCPLSTQGKYVPCPFLPYCKLNVIRPHCPYFFVFTPVDSIIYPRCINLVTSSLPGVLEFTIVYVYTALLYN